jgi:hypothetical protein
MKRTLPEASDRAKRVRDVLRSLGQFDTAQKNGLPKWTAR